MPSPSVSFASDSHRDLWVATAVPMTLPRAWEVHLVSRRERSVARRSSTTDGWSSPNDEASSVRSLAWYRCSSAAVLVVQAACPVAWCLATRVGRRGFWPLRIVGEAGER